MCFNLNLLLLILSEPLIVPDWTWLCEILLPFLLTLCLSFNCTTCNTTVWIHLLNPVQELSDFPTFFNFFVKSTTFSVKIQLFWEKVNFFGTNTTFWIDEKPQKSNIYFYWPTNPTNPTKQTKTKKVLV